MKIEIDQDLLVQVAWAEIAQKNDQPLTWNGRRFDKKATKELDLGLVQIEERDRGNGRVYRTIKITRAYFAKLQSKGRLIEDRVNMKFYIEK